MDTTATSSRGRSSAEHTFPVIKINRVGKRQARKLLLSRQGIKNMNGASVQWSRPPTEIHSIAKDPEDPTKFTISILHSYSFQCDEPESVEEIVDLFQQLDLGIDRSDEETAVVDRAATSSARTPGKAISIRSFLSGKKKDPSSSSNPPVGDKSAHPAPMLAVPDSEPPSQIHVMPSGDDLADGLACLSPAASPPNTERELEVADTPLTQVATRRLARIPTSHRRVLRPQNLELVSTVGKGSFGQVFLVRRDNSKLLAMKVLKKRDLIDRKQVEHTISEHRILQAIRHPFVVRLYHSFQTRTRIFMLLDFVDGGELFYHLRSVGRFPEALATFYVAEILLSLNHLHENDILYRDLKPENVLLDRQGHVRITDFGLSKCGITSVGGSEIGSTASTFCGTPEYIAPEVLVGVGHGKAVDFWTVGILFYEMLVGHAPFVHTQRTELYRRVLRGAVSIPHFISDEARSFISQCLQRRPEMRLGSSSFEEVKAHPVFALHNINWDTLPLKQTQPPFRLKISTSSPVANFDSRFTSQPPRMSPSKPGDSVTSEEDKLFREFGWTAPDAFDGPK